MFYFQGLPGKDGFPGLNGDRGEPVSEFNWKANFVN